MVCFLLGAATCYITSFVIVVGVSALNGLAVAGVAYYVYYLLTKKNHEAGE